MNTLYPRAAGPKNKNEKNKTRQSAGAKKVQKNAPIADPIVAQQITHILGPGLPKPLIKRLVTLVLGIIGAKQCAPSALSNTLHAMGLGEKASLERSLRRTENDERITQPICFHPLVRWHLNRVDTDTLVIALDPTTKRDKYVMVMLSVFYRGRSLPLLWTMWPANTPLLGQRFWERTGDLLDLLSTLVPARKNILIVADRAFGTAVFTDMIVEHGWHYVVRVQDQTRCRAQIGKDEAQMGKEGRIRDLIKPWQHRARMWGEVFKKQGWRKASVQVYWGSKHAKPMCLVSDLHARSLMSAWQVLPWYRSRASIEALFRDYKSYGWHWEQTQVSQQDHLERLLIGMALATWITIGLGARRGTRILERTGSGCRRSADEWSKQSLFEMGLLEADCILYQRRLVSALRGLWSIVSHQLLQWFAPNWQQQINAKISHEYLMAH